MILSDKQIKEEIDKGNIVITPFDENRLNPNSYDLTLSKDILTYENHMLDCKTNNPTLEQGIEENGLLLLPGYIYLAKTNEYTETYNLVPALNGKSSLGRLGLMVHITAGFGDNGFCGAWTLELAVIKPLRIYADMPVAQICYTTTGECILPYNEKKTSKYCNTGEVISSKMYENFTK